MSLRVPSLDPIFRPETVAVIGASPTPGSVGRILMRNLTENPFNGVVYPVNPRRRAVHGIHCYPKLSEVPEPVDLAVIATPAATVPGLIRECVACGVPGAIVISAGFSERGEQGRALEQEVLAAAQGRLRLLGPNCLGVILPPFHFNASFAAATPNAGHIALLSQSGAICTSVLDWAREVNIGFSAFVSLGAMIDVGFGDLIDYFGEDPRTRSIILYMESIGDARKFLSAARAVGRTKPIIVVKAGRHEAGARAAASHTGALASADAVCDAAFRRAGVLRVATIRDLFHMAEILATHAAPRGADLAIITNAGGPGVMAADSLMLQGGRLAELSPKTLAALNAALPEHWSHGNPIDILGDATPERYRQAVAICMDDPAIQGLLVLLTPQAMTNPTETARQLIPFANRSDKPILASWMGGVDVREGRLALDMADIATFDSPEAAIDAFLHMVQYRRNQELQCETPEAVPPEPAPNRDRVRRIIEAARRERRLLLTEAEAKEVLDAYRIPVVPTIACNDLDKAVAAARKLGYPAVLKLLSREITHKSDVDGVKLDLPDERALRNAFTAIRAGLAERGLSRAFQGVTVQPMMRGKGYELILGGSLDPQFGPVILFGGGGVLVEVFQDRALAIPPLNRVLARRLMEQTRVYRVLQRVRGMPAAPLEQLESILVRFSQLVLDFPEIAEIDVNPLLATAERIVALDARVLLAAPDAPESPPRATILPYPNQYAAPFRLRNGTEVLVRPVRPEDESLMVEMHHAFSENTIRTGFHAMVRSLSRENLMRLCYPDYDREMALAAVEFGGESPCRFAAVSRYRLHPETGVAECGLVVADGWRRQGLGTHLLERLIAIARERGVARLSGQVLRENTTMLRLTKKLGFDARPTRDPAVVEVILDLAREPR